MAIFLDNPPLYLLCFVVHISTKTIIILLSLIRYLYNNNNKHICNNTIIISLTTRQARHPPAVSTTLNLLHICKNSDYNSYSLHEILIIHFQSVFKEKLGNIRTSFRALTTSYNKHCRLSIIIKLLK